MQGCDDKARKAILKELKSYVDAIYRDDVSVDSLCRVHAFRGFVHGLGWAGLISREIEFCVCAFDFSEVSRRRAWLRVKQQLELGFLMVATGQQSLFDKVYEEIVTDNKENV